jgi:DNA-binding NtrC family response regulator
MKGATISVVNFHFTDKIVKRSRNAKEFSKDAVKFIAGIRLDRKHCELRNVVERLILGGRNSKMM